MDRVAGTRATGLGRRWARAAAVVALGLSACAPPSGPGPSLSPEQSPATSGSSAAQRPEDGLFVYQSGQTLYLVGTDGSDPRPVFDDGMQARSPDWSPDGSSIAFVHDDEDGTTDIWVTPRDGDGRRRLIDCQEVCSIAEDPAWSPDGRQIAYWTSGEGAADSVRVASADSGEVLLTVPSAALTTLVRPRWSPDGTRLAVGVMRYAADESGFSVDGSAIGIIDLAAPKPTITPVTGFEMLASSPAWSPDGERIVFRAGNLTPFDSPDDPTNLSTMRPDGSDMVQITDVGPDGPGIATPDWTWGTHPIAVTLIQGPGESTLAVIDPDGRNLTDLIDPATGEPVEGSRPRRSPVLARDVGPEAGPLLGSRTVMTGMWPRQGSAKMSPDKHSPRIPAFPGPRFEPRIPTSGG